jgi:oligosaccharide repeat unit polymerase
MPTPAEPRPAGGALVRAQLLAIGLLVACRLIGLSAGGGDGALTVASALFLALAAWHLWSWRRASGVLLDPYGMFLLAATIFNGGQTLLQVTHANEDGMLNGDFDPATLIDVLFLIALGLACMHLGALFAVTRRRRRAPAEATPAPAPADVRRAGFALLLLSAPFSVLVLGDALQTVLSSGYLALYQTEAATGVGAGPAVLAAFLVPAALFLLAGSEPGRPTSARVATVVITLYALIQLFLGRRYYAAMSLCAFAWLWHVRIRPIPRWVTLAAGGFAFFVIFPLVAATRLQSGSDRLSLAVLLDAFGDIDNVFVSILKELGSSMGATANTMALVPSARPYDFGLSYFYAALTLMPNLFWDIHPSIAAGTPSFWLTWAVDPWSAALGGGLGYSFLAEGYLNFGWIGVPAVGLGVGYGYARFVRWTMDGRQPARLATLATVAAFFTFFVRAESAVIVRAVVYYGLVPYWALGAWARHRGRVLRPAQVSS